MSFNLYHNPVRDLLIDKFDSMSVNTVMGWLNSASSPNKSPPVDKSTIEAIKAEFARLDSLSESALEQEYCEFKENQRAAEIAGRWYNRPEYSADYRHWLKMSYWSVEEGLMLLFGYDPRRLTYANIEKSFYTDPFCEHMRDGLEMAKRSIQVKALRAYNSPNLFVTWANDVEIIVPEKLSAALAQIGYKILSSAATIEAKSSQFEELKSNFESLLETASRQNKTCEDLLRSLDEKNTELMAWKEKFEKVEQAGYQKPTDPRYTKSLQKIIIALVCDCYGYQVYSKKSKAIHDIQSALAELGFEMSDDTIRSILKQSEKYISDT